MNGQKQDCLEILKDVIAKSQQSDVEAMLLHSEILMEKGKLDKAFFLLNHCLKFEYKNPLIWQLLGEVYQKKVKEQNYDGNINMKE